MSKAAYKAVFAFACGELHGAKKKGEGRNSPARVFVFNLLKTLE